MSEDECKHFILDPELGDKWLEIMEALLEKLKSGIMLEDLVGGDTWVVKQSCNLFRKCAFELDNSIDIVKKIFDVSNNILK